MSKSEYIYLIKCTWLTKFLTHRGLKITDSRPLFEYHATSEEYEELKRLLCGVGCLKDLKTIKVTQHALHYFAQNGIEGNTNEFMAGVGTIYKALGLSLSPSELSHIVPKGLEDYWGRPVRFYDSERRNFWISLVKGVYPSSS